MNKYIQQFLNDNNLKVNEKFKIDGNDYYYFFSNDGYLCYETPTLGWVSVSSCLVDILNGKYKIEKLSNIPTERFIPKENDRFWFVNRFGCVDDDIFYNNILGDYCVRHNLVFRTKEEAKDYKWFLDKVEEYKKPFVIEKPNHYLYVDLCGKLVCYSCSHSCKNQGTIYFGDEKNISEFMEEVGEERIKKYMFDIWQEQD